MSIAPAKESKPMFTPEQRLALSRVYSFLMELGRQRLNRLKGNEADIPTLLQEHEEVAVDETASTENGTTPGK
jgi:hypothetical protein